MTTVSVGSSTLQINPATEIMTGSVELIDDKGNTVTTLTIPIGTTLPAGTTKTVAQAGGFTLEATWEPANSPPTDAEASGTYDQQWFEIPVPFTVSGGWAEMG